jgi:hypothetical protein
MSSASGIRIFYMQKLEILLSKIPGIEKVASNKEESGYWWIKFSIDIEHRLSWHIIQEFGHIVNYISVNEPLPTIFYPVSPPPYLNGGPKLFLSWVIENKHPLFTPDNMADWLEARLPDPLDDESKWYN